MSEQPIIPETEIKFWPSFGGKGIQQMLEAQWGEINEIANKQGKTFILKSMISTSIWLNKQTCSLKKYWNIEGICEKK
jgi:hypothetical protein